MVQTFDYLKSSSGKVKKNGNIRSAGECSGVDRILWLRRSMTRISVYFCYFFYIHIIIVFIYRRLFLVYEYCFEGHKSLCTVCFC